MGAFASRVKRLSARRRRILKDKINFEGSYEAALPDLAEEELLF